MNDYFNWIKTGYFKIQLKVYGRDGEKCKSCETKISKITQNNRSTYFCKESQNWCPNFLLKHFWCRHVQILKYHHLLLFNHARGNKVSFSSAKNTLSISGFCDLLMLAIWNSFKIWYSLSPYYSLSINSDAKSTVSLESRPTQLIFSWSLISHLSFELYLLTKISNSLLSSSLRQLWPYQRFLKILKEYRYVR